MIPLLAYKPICIQDFYYSKQNSPTRVGLCWSEVFTVNLEGK